MLLSSTSTTTNILKPNVFSFNKNNKNNSFSFLRQQTRQSTIWHTTIVGIMSASTSSTDSSIVELSSNVVVVDVDNNKHSEAERVLVQQKQQKQQFFFTIRLEPIMTTSLLSG
jgi:hypothetical protein